MVDDLVIDALVEIGNHEKVVKVCEPDVFCPQELKGWMVRRTLYALGLFEQEMEKCNLTNKTKS